MKIAPRMATNFALLRLATMLSPALLLAVAVWSVSAYWPARSGTALSTIFAALAQQLADELSVGRGTPWPIIEQR